MKRVSWYSAALLSLVGPAAFGGVPEINVKAICNARTADAKLMHSSPIQSTEDCVRDEEGAKQQLSNLWASTPVSIKYQCRSDARSLGMTGYIDLLACTYLALDLKSGQQAR